MKMQKGAWINFAALILVNLLWAAQYPAYKIAGDSMESATLNFWTLLFASVFLVPLWLREKQKRKTARKAFDWKTLREYLLLGVLGIVPPSVMLSWGIGHSSASNAAILSLTIPVLMTGLGVLMLGEKLSLIRAFSLLLGFVGTLLVSTSDLSQASFSRSLLLGNFVILIAGLGSAFYNTYSKDLLSRYSELEVLIFSYAVGVAACAVISAAFETRPFYRVAGYSGATWLAVAVLGLLKLGSSDDFVDVGAQPARGRADFNFDLSASAFRIDSFHCDGPRSHYAAANSRGRADCRRDCNSHIV